MRIYLTTILGYALITLVAWPLGVIKLTLASAITASMLRIFSGGAHSSCSRNCILSGAVIFPLWGVGAQNLMPSSPEILLVIIFAVAVSTTIAVFLFAPAETPGKPISTIGQRNKLRRWSFVVIFIWTVLSWSVLKEILNISNYVVFASALGLLWQGFSLAPVGYKFVALTDRILNKC